MDYDRIALVDGKLDIMILDKTIPAPVEPSGYPTSDINVYQTTLLSPLATGTHTIKIYNWNRGGD